MWSIHSVGDRVVPAFCCLIFTLIAGVGQAQTASDAPDSKRAQVLQITEGTPTKEIALKKHKSAAAHAKKKVAHRNNLSQTKAPTSEAAPPGQNDISTPAVEQTGTLAFADRLVAFASSAGDENDVGLSVANYVGHLENRQVRLPSNMRRLQKLTPGSPPPVRCRDGSYQPTAPLYQSLSNVERGYGCGLSLLVFCQIKPETFHF